MKGKVDDRSNISGTKRDIDNNVDNDYERRILKERKLHAAMEEMQASIAKS
jgi:hypothetical protein